MYTDGTMDGLSNFIKDPDLYLFDRGEAQCAYKTFGAHPLPGAKEGTFVFVVWAPGVKSVSIVGDFNDWDASASPMKHIHNGVWGCVIDGLHDGSLYKYCIVDSAGKEHIKADPFAFHSENGLSTASKVWDLSGYDWKDAAYMEDRRQRDLHKEPMSIYEFHLGSWRLPDDGESLPNYRDVADQLVDYCKEMGYTHIEPMPLTEYPLPASWGYQTTGYYSITSRYGTPQDFMYFVDVMHENGIGVILDWVPSHFPKDSFALAKFTGEELYEYKDPRKGEHKGWGTLVFDYGRPQVVSFLVSAAMFLFDVYHIDGLRVDAVSSMIYLDYDRDDWVPNKEGGNINLEAIAFLQRLNESVLTSYPGTAMVAEESTAYPMVTYPPYEGGLGFTFKWNMGFMHDTLDYAKTDSLFRSGNHHKMTFSMDYAYSEAFILEFSHDEVVYGKGSMVNKMFGEYEQKFATLRALMGYQFAHPGKKLTFMGSEFAQFDEWDFQRELQWELLEYPIHSSMQRFSADLNAVYLRYPALWRNDMDYDGFMWANKNNRDQNALAFIRHAIPGTATFVEPPDVDDSDIVCCFNFSPNAIDGLTIGLPCNGALKEVFNSNDVVYGGDGEGNPLPVPIIRGSFEGLPYHASVDIPPFSCVYFVLDKQARGGWSMNQHQETVAMILAGGQGSRLGVLTRHRAKPAVPFGGKYRIIDFPLSNCANSGIDVVGALTQYEPFVLNSYIGTGSPWDLDSPTGGVYVLSPHTRVGDIGRWYAGTADAIYQNINFVDRYSPDYIVVLSGDHIYKMDYAQMVAFHKYKGAEATIAVMPVPFDEASRFGILATNDEDEITDFVEKPENPPSNLASMGVYVFSWGKVRSYLIADAENPNSSHDFGKDIIPAMLAASEKMVAYSFEGYWRDVGTVESLWEANMDLLEKDARLDLSDKAWRIYSRTPFMPAAYLDVDCYLERCLVPEGCDVAGSVIHSVLFQGVQVDIGAKIEDSVIMRSAMIGQGASVCRAVIAEDVVIGDGCKIGGDGELCVIGSGARILPGTVIASGETVEPDTVVKPGERSAQDETIEVVDTALGSDNGASEGEEA